jgi:coproporphyrinogen III oxidase-like Fe-S oxidoreductase
VSEDLRARLARVRAALASSPDPLADPLGLDFEPRTGRRHDENWQRFVEAARAGRVHDHVVLYVHLPFCAKICSYCLLSAQRPESRDGMSRYVEAIVRELRRHGELFRGVPVSSFHVGGGTPTLLSTADLARVLEEAERAFARTDDFTGDLEAHPTTASAEKLDLARKHGITRISLGVESFTERVLELVNRGDQTQKSVETAVNHARSAGLSLNVDLLAGLPGETLESFETSLKRALELDVGALSVNRYLVEGSPLGAYGYTPERADVDLASRMLARADELVRAHKPPAYPPPSPERPAWGVQYSWANEAERKSYSQQDMIDPGSVLAIGHGGMGRVHAGYHYIVDRDVEGYTRAVLNGESPDVLVCKSDARFEMAFFVTDRACRTGVTDADFVRVFRARLSDVFGPELEYLLSEGLLSMGTAGYWKPKRKDFDAACFVAFLADRKASNPGQKFQISPTNAIQATERLRRPGNVLPADEARIDEYAEVDAELPPQLLWCRLAMRAARAARKGRTP